LTTVNSKRPACIYIGAFWIILLFACSSSPESLRQKIKELAASDLNDIQAELRENGCDSALSSNPYFEIKEFKIFTGDTGRVYKAYTKVDFYYLKSLKLYQTRKYRYRTDIGIWDRYDIKLKHLYTKGRKEKKD
jgi:hypothetical protein